MVNAENFCEVCSIFSFQPCYVKFSNSLVQYLAIFQTNEQFIVTMKSKKFNNLLQFSQIRVFFLKEKNIISSLGRLMMEKQNFLLGSKLS